MNFSPVSMIEKDIEMLFFFHEEIPENYLT
jgi:hypothetical protein